MSKKRQTRRPVSDTLGSQHIIYQRDSKFLQTTYEALFESVANMIWSVDVIEYRLVTYNTALRVYFSDTYNIEIRAGQLPKDIFLEITLLNYWISLYERAAKGESFQIDYQIPSTNRTLSVSLNPMYVEGNLIGISVFTKDITDLHVMNQKLKEEINKYKELVENTSDYVFLVDATTYDSIIYNSAARTFILNEYGIDIKETVHKSDLFPSFDLDFWAQKYKEVIDSIHINFRRKSVKGDFVLDFSMHFLELDQELYQILVIAKDVTSDVVYQEQLFNLNLKLKEQLGESIHAISKLGELRDPYTAGHQKRVRSLCAAITQKMNLSEDLCENIGLASLIHDIGKVYVPSEILNKPGRLSAIEFELIKTHPGFGYEIIKDIGLPTDVGIMVLQHHERLDGSGYPTGLKDDEIGLGSYILAVADVIEAMSSHRPYRVALGVDVALKEIEDNSGIKYHPDVVNACLEVFREGFIFDSIF